MSNIGRVVGYSGGAFSSDSYHLKRIEAEGFDWVVARRVDWPSYRPEFACWVNPERMQQDIDAWAEQAKKMDEYGQYLDDR